MILVAGATGLLGMAICRQLSESGKSVRALVRDTSDAAKVEALREMGAELVRGDLKEPASLALACQGVSHIISTASSTLSRQEGDTIQSVDHDGQLALIESAKAAGVEHFVFISFRPDTGNTYPLDDAKRTVENSLKSSGMVYTVFQAGYFMEVWLSPALGFNFPEATARIYGSGENAISYISFTDVARFAVAALDNAAARNAVIEIGGPEALTPLDVVKCFEEVSGTSFTVEHVPHEALIAQKEGAPDPLTESFSGLMISYSNGDAIDMSETLRAFPIDLVSVQDYANQVAGGN
jgi:NADH dehydrogenase